MTASAAIHRRKKRIHGLPHYVRNDSRFMERKSTAKLAGAVLPESYANSVHVSNVKATFVELPPFEKVRSSYLDDTAYRELQIELMANPLAGDVIEGTGGLRKLRQSKVR